MSIKHTTLAASALAASLSPLAAHADAATDGAVNQVVVTASRSAESRQDVVSPVEMVSARKLVTAATAWSGDA